MITRSTFSAEEWQEIWLAPFWMAIVLCEKISRPAPDMQALFLAELADPQLYPRLTRLIFLAAAENEENAWEIVMRSPEAAKQKLEIVRNIFSAKAAPEEALMFQLSLAVLGRTLLKYYGAQLGGLNTLQRLEALWESVGINSISPSLSKSSFSPDEWRRLELSMFFVWKFFARPEDAFAAKIAAATFPAFVRELMTNAAKDARQLEAISVSFAESLANFNRTIAFVNERLNQSAAIFFKSMLLMTARDALEKALPHSPPPTKISFGEAGQKEYFKLAQALGLLPEKPARKAEYKTSPKIKIPPEVIKEKPAIVSPQSAVEAKISKPTVKAEKASKPQTKIPAVEQVEKVEAAVATSETAVDAAEAKRDEPANVESLPLPPSLPAPMPESENISADAQVETKAPDSVAVEQTNNGSSQSSPSANKVEASENQLQQQARRALFRRNSQPLRLSLDSFVDYRRTVHIIAEDLQDLAEIADELRLAKTGELVNEVLERVRENSFSVAVVGEFKRGKSTFINALLGKDILPSDILPCSATLNRVTYGIKPSVTVRFKDGKEEIVEIGKLAEYVTKLTEESEERAATVREAIVTYPIPYCQNNVEIIDTPGLNDEANMTEVTLSVLPQVDAAILVIMAQSPFSEYEREFLEEKLLTSDLGRVIFVVTAIDRLNRPEDADRLVADIKRRINKFVMKRAAGQYGENSPEYEVYMRKIGTPRVFGLSAYKALEAKTKGDAALMSASRFGEFERALEEFLSKERGAIFLQVPLNRLQAATGDVIAALTIRENALEMQQAQFEEAFQKSVQEIEALRVRKTEELKQIDVAAERVELQVIPMLEQMDETLKAEAARAIDAAEIEHHDLSSKESTERTCKRIGEQVARALQSVGQKNAEKIQTLIEKAIAEEAERWKDFSESLSTMMKGIETRFTGASGENESSGGAKAVETGLGAVAVLTGFGAMYSGYKVAGWKGIATGGAAMIATNIGTMIAVGLVSSFAAAFAGPILIIGIISSYFAGGWLTKVIFGDEKIKRFRENFKKTTLEQIDRHLTEQGTREQVLQQIKETFLNLKEKAHQEIESTLSDTQETLYATRAKRERDETLSETEKARLAELREKVQEIRERAGELNKLLVSQLLGDAAEKESDDGATNVSSNNAA